MTATLTRQPVATEPRPFAALAPGVQTEETRQHIAAVVRDLGPTRLARYRVSLAFTGKLLAGVPKDGEVIDAWLRKNLPNAGEEEIRQKLLETLGQLGVTPESIARDGEPTWEQIRQASALVSEEKKTNGFKVDPTYGLYYEGRCLKAALKEGSSVVYSGRKWGPTKKGTRNYVAERLFVVEDVIPLGRQRPDGVELIIGHVSGPQGERSTLTRYEYVNDATITFTMLALDDCFSDEDWYAVFDYIEWGGLGAARSQQHGRVRVLQFARLPWLPRHWTIGIAKD